MIGGNHLLKANFQPVPVGVRVVTRGGLGWRGTEVNPYPPPPIGTGSVARHGRRSEENLLVEDICDL
jgi:hypothetical protein